MSNKEMVIEAVRKLPENASLDQISEQIAMLAAIRRGERAIEEGKMISHEVVRERSESWSSKSFGRR